MSLIEGIGDEVINFVIVSLTLIISWISWCWIEWWSTNISNQPLTRTILILQRRSSPQVHESTVNQDVTNAQNLNNIRVNVNNRTEERNPESSNSSMLI